MSELLFFVDKFITSPLRSDVLAVFVVELKSESARASAGTGYYFRPFATEGRAEHPSRWEPTWPKEGAPSQKRLPLLLFRFR